MNHKIPLAGPWITQKEQDYVQDAVINGWYETYDLHIKRLETTFADRMGVKYAIATFCGTHALHLAALALELKPGDEVIVTDQSFIATAHALSYVGAKCVFVDTKRESLCLDPSQIEQAITPHTKAIMLVHFAGFSCDMDAIMDIANRHSLRVIEDACQSVGTRWRGRYTGTIGDVGAYSFQGSKIAVGGEGGMFVTNQKELYLRARHYGTFCRNDAIQFLWSDDIGFNYRISNITAALVLAQIERLDELIANKKRIFDTYQSILADSPYFEMLMPPAECQSNYSYVLGYLKDSVHVDRDTIVHQMLKRNIHVRPGYPSMSRMPHYERTRLLPNSDLYDHRGLVFPTAHSLTEADILTTCRVFQEVVEQYV